MNITQVSFKLRELYMKDEVIFQFCSFNEIFNIVHKHIQRSRYENLILNLALAYDGYQFDLPAFLNFRGRIYRSGILHFHERDLARSLIIFADKKDEDIKFSVGNNFLPKSFFAATAFHDQSFDSVDDATSWFCNNMMLPRISDHQILSYTLDAKRYSQAAS